MLMGGVFGVLQPALLWTGGPAANLQKSRTVPKTATSLPTLGGLHLILDTVVAELRPQVGVEAIHRLFLRRSKHLAKEYS
jgi:hypothetical protein